MLRRMSDEWKKNNEESGNGRGKKVPLIVIVTCFGFARVVAFPNLEVLYYRCEVKREGEKKMQC